MTGSPGQLLRSAGLARLPPYAPGLRIGLYGGSFDPPHAGHRHVAEAAFKRLRLDRVWWLVSPGNPLKDRTGLPSAAERLRAVAGVARHPRMIASALETAIGARYTVETIRFLRVRCPGVRFVFILGADSFAHLHRWRAWREIAALVPLAVVDRPGWTARALLSPAARTLAARRIGEGDRLTLAQAKPPAWVFLTGPRSTLSSTALRDKTPRALDRR